MAFQQNIISALGTIANLAEFNKLRTGITNNRQNLEEQKTEVGDLNKEVYKTGEFISNESSGSSAPIVNANNTRSNFSVMSNKDISKRDGYYKKIRAINKKLNDMDISDPNRGALTERLNGLIEEKNKLNARMKAASASYSAAHDFFGTTNFIDTLSTIKEEDDK